MAESGAQWDLNSPAAIFSFFSKNKKKGKNKTETPKNLRKTHEKSRITLVHQFWHSFFFISVYLCVGSVANMTETGWRVCLVLLTVIGLSSANQFEIATWSVEVCFFLFSSSFFLSFSFSNLDITRHFSTTDHLMSLHRLSLMSFRDLVGISSISKVILAIPLRS